MGIQDIRKILFFADGAGDEKEALRRTVTLAEDLGANLKVMDVVAEVSTNDTNPAVVEAITSLQKTLIDDRLGSLKALIEACDIETKPELGVVAGRDDVEVIKTVSAEAFDLVVKAPNKPSLISRAFFGEADLKLLRKCPSPVWIMKPAGADGLNKIVVAVDPLDVEHRDLNRNLVDVARYLSRVEQSELIVVGCWSLPFDVSLEARLDQNRLEMIRDHIIKQCHDNLSELVSHMDEGACRVELLNGAAEDLIPEYVAKNQIDLVVMGTLARVGLPGFIIGNTAEKIIHTIESSVLALKPKGFTCPVTSL